MMNNPDARLLTKPQSPPPVCFSSRYKSCSPAKDCWSLLVRWRSEELVLDLAENESQFSFRPQPAGANTNPQPDFWLLFLWKLRTLQTLASPSLDAFFTTKVSFIVSMHLCLRKYQSRNKKVLGVLSPGVQVLLWRPCVTQSAGGIKRKAPSAVDVFNWRRPPKEVTPQEHRRFTHRLSPTTERLNFLQGTTASRKSISACPIVSQTRRDAPSLRIRTLRASV